MKKVYKIFLFLICMFICSCANSDLYADFDDTNKNGVWDKGENFVDIGKARGRQAIVKSIVSKVQEKFNSEKTGHLQHLRFWGLAHPNV